MPALPSELSRFSSMRMAPGHTGTLPDGQTLIQENAKLARQLGEVTPRHWTVGATGACHPNPASAVHATARRSHRARHGFVDAAPEHGDEPGRNPHTQSTMNSVAPTSVEERWGSALSATW